MTKHRAFHSDRFVDKFQEHESILRAYIQLWDKGLGVKASSIDVGSFKDFIVNGDGASKEAFLDGLYRVYDLCTERGHEDLVAACQDHSYEPDPTGKLPVEVLSLKVRTENEDAFNLAYDRSTLRQAERFSVFQGAKGQAIKNLAKATERLHGKLSEVFKGDKHSDRVLIRHYEEGPRVNFIVYHEKRTQALLIFKGTKTKPKVAPEIFRPAQQDFISYNSESGQVEVEARFEKEEDTLRQSFAECCLGAADFFESDEAAKRLTLDPITLEGFEPKTDGSDTAALTELHFRLSQKYGPYFIVRSKDVLETLQLNGLRKKLPSGTIQKAVFKITFQGDRRGKKVGLSGTNKIAMNRATHAEDVYRYLRRWKILRD